MFCVEVNDPTLTVTCLLISSPGVTWHVINVWLFDVTKHDEAPILTKTPEPDKPKLEPKILIILPPEVIPEEGKIELTI